MWDTYNNKANYFWLNFFLLMSAAIVCFAMLRWLNKIMKEKGVQ
jgi:POT family proton-dependent oligopeptide transporter